MTQCLQGVTVIVRSLNFDCKSKTMCHRHRQRLWLMLKVASVQVNGYAACSNGFIVQSKQFQAFITRSYIAATDQRNQPGTLDPFRCLLSRTTA